MSKTGKHDPGRKALEVGALEQPAKGILQSTISPSDQYEPTSADGGRGILDTDSPRNRTVY